MAKLFSKQARRSILVRILPPLAFFLLKLLYLSCKKNFHSTTQVPTKPSIYALWHGEILMMPFGYWEYAQRKTVDVMISRHSDGEMIARVIQFFGGGVVRGSSSKGGSSVLRSAFKSLSSGRDIAITPDGPRGPRYSVAEGIVYLSQLQQIPIITMNYRASSSWKMRSWDAFCIPKPFSTLDFYFGEPFFVNDLSMEEAKEMIRKRLLEHAMLS